MRIGVVATAAGAVFLLWTQLSTGHPLTWLPLVIAAGALVGALVANARGREGWAFAAIDIGRGQRRLVASILRSGRRA